MSDHGDNGLLVLAQAAMEVQKKQVNPVDDENNHTPKSTSATQPRKTPVIVKTHEAHRWPAVVTDFADLLRQKHITPLEPDQPLKQNEHHHANGLNLATATPATVLKHAVDITKNLKALKNAKARQLSRIRGENERHQKRIGTMEDEIRRSTNPDINTRQIEHKLIMARRTAESEVESRKNQVPKVRDRTYSETLPVANTKPLIRPGKRRPTNGAQYTQFQLGKSIDACTLMGSLERQRTNSFNAQRPAKQKKTCQDTNNESLKNRPV